MQNKKNGIYYTPQVLAEYLAEPLVFDNNQTILDPAYGEGSLLLAAERIYSKKNPSSDIHLFGCDTKPVNGLLKHLPEANLSAVDFFEYSVEKKFQTILMNPPYVRHHIQNFKKIEKYRTFFPELKILNQNADLWSYFIVKAVSHLQKDGSIGAILPWAFLQADYAKPLRKWLSEIFGEIKVVALSDKYFEGADERVVVIWLKEYGKKCQSIKIASSKSINPKIIFSKLSLSNWNSDRVFYSGANDIESILSKYKSEYGFAEFSNFADVKIGIVTGAVDYFIMPKKQANEIGFAQDRLIPILTSSDEFPDYIKKGKQGLSLLVALRNKDHLKYKKYILKGIDEEYNLRVHSELREPWYAVKIGKVPDAFFHYRITRIPYLLPNHDKIQCTNSIHRIYYKKLSELERKWIAVSMLSFPSQLSVETNSKTYGRGILKIEPKSLKNTLVFKRKDSIVNSTYKKVLTLLSENKKEKAVLIASEFICSELKISNDFMVSTKKVLENLQELRITTKKR